MSTHLPAVTTADFADRVLGADGPVVVDCWAPWCAPCRMLTPVLGQIAQEVPETQVVALNVDESPEIAQQFGVRSIPTLLRFEGGEVVATQVGLVSRPALVAFVKGGA